MRLTEAELDQFRRDGFLIRPNLFTSAEVALLRAQLAVLFDEETPANIREKDKRGVRTSMGLHLRNPRAPTPSYKSPRADKNLKVILSQDELFQDSKS